MSKEESACWKLTNDLEDVEQMSVRKVEGCFGGC